MNLSHLPRVGLAAAMLTYAAYAQAQSSLLTEPQPAASSVQETAPSAAAVPAPAAKLAKGDQEFICEAYTSGIYELKISRLAALRANSTEVRRFAQEMSEAHSRSHRKLREIALTRDYRLCERLDHKRLARLLELQRRAGDEFDREYLTQQVVERRRMLGVYRSYAQGPSDKELSDFAAQRTAELETRLWMAQTLADNR